MHMPEPDTTPTEQTESPKTSEPAETAEPPEKDDEPITFVLSDDMASKWKEPSGRNENMRLFLIFVLVLSVFVILYMLNRLLGLNVDAGCLIPIV